MKKLKIKIPSVKPRSPIPPPSSIHQKRKSRTRDRIEIRKHVDRELNDG